MLMGLGVIIFTNFIYPPTPVSWEKISRESFIGTVSALLIVISAYFALIKIIYLMNHNNEMQHLRSLQWVLKRELSAEKEYVSQTKEYRHDLRHHLKFIFSLAQKGDLEKIKSYLMEFDKTLDSSTLTSYSKNTVINAFLCNFARKAREAGIKCQIHCDIPEKLPLSDFELCSLFGNLLENAEEACRKSPNPSFSLHTYVKGGGLYLQTKNTAPCLLKFTKGLPISTKKNGGQGSKNMQMIVNNHSGLIEFSQQDNEFLVQIILPL